MEWNREFENLTGWSYEGLKYIDKDSKILWPINPQECKVCKIVGKYDKELKKSGYGLAEIIDKNGNLIPVFVYVIPIFENDKLLRTYVILRNRREEIKQREEFLRQKIEKVLEKIKKFIKEADKSENPLEMLKNVISSLVDTLQALAKDINASAENV